MSPNPQVTADLVTFTEEIRHGNFIFCAVCPFLIDYGSLNTYFSGTFSLNSAHRLVFNCPWAVRRTNFPTPDLG